MRITRLLKFSPPLLCVGALLSACGGGGDNSNESNSGVGPVTRPPPATYTISGTVTGLSGTLALQNNGGNGLSLTANGPFIFSSSVSGGAAYSVAVQSQPPGQTCTVADGSGTATANVTNVAVTCVASGSGSFSIGGNIADLTGSGLVLRVNGAGDLTVASGSTSFSFPTSIATGSTYSVSIATQPSGQTCQVLNATGTIGSSAVASVQVNCKFAVGGTIDVGGARLADGLILSSAFESLAVPAGATGFQFRNRQSANTAYAVFLTGQPPGQTCTLNRAFGVMQAADVTNVTIQCVNARTPTPLAGSYTLTLGGTPLRGALTFLPDGTYILGIHANDGTCSANNGTGVEYGAYSFDEATGALTWLSSTVDTNGNCGIHDAITNRYTHGTGFAKNPNNGLLTGTFIDGARNIPVTLTPVESRTGQLVGAWAANRMSFTVYFGDGTALGVTTQAVQNLAESAVGIEDACLNGVVPSAAIGTYAVDFGSTCRIAGALPAIDTTGPTGILGGSSGSVGYSVINNSMNLTLPLGSGGTTTAVFERVITF